MNRVTLLDVEYIATTLLNLLNQIYKKIGESEIDLFNIHQDIINLSLSEVDKFFLKDMNPETIKNLIIGDYKIYFLSNIEELPEIYKKSAFMKFSLIDELINLFKKCHFTEKRIKIFNNEFLYLRNKLVNLIAKIPGICFEIDLQREQYKKILNNIIILSSNEIYLKKEINNIENILISKKITKNKIDAIRIAKKYISENYIFNNKTNKINDNDLLKMLKLIEILNIDEKSELIDLN